MKILNEMHKRKATLQNVMVDYLSKHRATTKVKLDFRNDSEVLTSVFMEATSAYTSMSDELKVQANFISTQVGGRQSDGDGDN